MISTAPTIIFKIIIAETGTKIPVSFPARAVRLIKNKVDMTAPRPKRYMSFRLVFLSDILAEKTPAQKTIVSGFDNVSSIGFYKSAFGTVLLYQIYRRYQTYPAGFQYDRKSEKYKYD